MFKFKLTVMTGDLNIEVAPDFYLFCEKHNEILFSHRILPEAESSCI